MFRRYSKVMKVNAVKGTEDFPKQLKRLSIIEQEEEAEKGRSAKHKLEQLSKRVDLDEHFLQYTKSLTALKENGVPGIENFRSEEILMKIFELYGEIPDKIDEDVDHEDEIESFLRNEEGIASVTPQTPTTPGSAKPKKPKRGLQKPILQPLPVDLFKNVSPLLRKLSVIDKDSMRKKLTLKKLKQVLRDSLFITEQIGDADALLSITLYEKYHNPLLGFSDVFIRLCRVAVMRYPQLSTRAAMDKACRLFFVPYIQKTVKRATRMVDSFSYWITDDADIAAMFHYYNAPLTRVFSYFAKKEKDYVKPLSSFQHFMRQNTVALQEFLIFLSEFEILPKLVTQAQVIRIFSTIKGRSVEHQSVAESLDFSEFIECLARIATEAIRPSKNIVKELREINEALKEHRFQSENSSDISQYKCKLLLDRIDERYHEIFGETMEGGRERSITEQHLIQSRNSAAQKSTHSIDTILGKDRNLTSLGKQSASNLYMADDERLVDGSTSKPDPEQEKKNLLLKMKKAKRHFQLYGGKISRPDEKESDVISAVGVEVFKHLKRNMILSTVFNAYISCNVDEKGNKLFQTPTQAKLHEKNLRLLQWQFFCDDFKLHSVYKTKYRHSNAEEASDYFDSVFVNRSTSVIDKVLHMTYSNFMHSIFDMSQDLYDAIDSQENLSKEQRFMVFFNNLLSPSNLDAYRARLRVRNETAAMIVEQQQSNGSQYNVSIIPKRASVQLDIYKGPKLIGYVENVPGHIIRTAFNGNLSGCPKNPFLRMKIYDDIYEKLLMRELDNSQGFFHFIDRLIVCGIDLSAHALHAEQHIIGRGWRVYKGSLCIAFILDSPGQFGCIEWQAVEGELESKLVTMTVYKFEDVHSLEFMDCISIFKTAKSVEQIRLMFAGKNYKVIPML